MSLTTRNAVLRPGGPLRGELVAPPDKAVSHRAALLAAMGEEPVRVTNYLDAADTNSTLQAVRRLGADVRPDGPPGAYVIAGVGLDGAGPLDAPIDVGNSGTLLRFLPGWLAGQPEGRAWTLDGDDSIRRRPIDRIKAPLELMGADIRAREGRLAPFDVTARPLQGITYELPVASAQVKSCVLLAGMMAAGETRVVEPAPSRDHTERMLTRAGVDLRREANVIVVSRPAAFGLDAIHVPGDPSSAAFHVAAALIVPGSRIVVRGMAANWGRVGFYAILRRMGARLEGELETQATAARDTEPLCDLEVIAGPLTGTIVEADEVPLAIDELPLVALLGCFAEGETVVRGARELRVKETDRIATVVDGLRAQGAEIEATEDGFVVQGTGGLRGGGLIPSHGDHRLAMLGAVAGIASREGVEVAGMDAAVVSYPGFEADLAALRG
jgi:3-phosphoshikimate 1-carboxyvinyltransferase